MFWDLGLNNRSSPWLCKGWNELSGDSITDIKTKIEPVKSSKNFNSLILSLLKIKEVHC